MTILKFDAFRNDIFTKGNAIGIQILYRTDQKPVGVWTYSCPRDILDDIGAKELASRIYSVFKQHVSRPASE